MAYKVMFLGTCACDFSQKLTTEFKDCFDKNVRRASSIIIGKNLLVDCGPHVLESLKIAGYKAEDIDNIFITHLHSDHFNYDNISAIAQQHDTPINLWVRRDAEVKEIENVKVIKKDEQAEYQITQDISVTALDANHDEQSFPQWFLFEMSNKKLLYALDGAWFLTKTYDFLKNSRVSCMIVDATCGNYIGDYRIAEHNSIPMIKMMIPSMKTVGIISDFTKIYMSHIAPSLHSPHTEIEKQVKDLDIKVAFDGLSISI